VREEAEAAVVRDPKALPKIIGYDEDFRAVRVALGNLEAAGMRGFAHVEKRELGALERPAEKGLLAVNPPYGERMGDVEALKPLYRRLGDTFKQKLKGWEAYVFTGSPELAKEVGLRASRKDVLFNGAMECRLLRYELF
jgi:23S rRNA G2445 N2-methylase RlmL